MKVVLAVDEFQIECMIPASTKEVLEYTTFIGPKLSAAIRHPESRGLLQAMTWAMEWISSYSNRGFDWFDENLTALQIHQTCNRLISVATVDSHLTEEVKSFAEVIGAGGCECSLCENPEKAKQWSKETRDLWKKKCNYKEISNEASHMIGTVSSIEGADPLSMPYYLYDLREHYLIGINTGRARKHREREKKQKVMDRLKEAGIRR